MLQYGERIWGIQNGTDEERIQAAIAKTRAFFESLDVPTRLSRKDVPESLITEIPARLVKRKDLPLGERGHIGEEQVRKIMALAFEPPKNA